MYAIRSYYGDVEGDGSVETRGGQNQGQESEGPQETGCSPGGEELDGEVLRHGLRLHGHDPGVHLV